MKRISIAGMCFLMVCSACSKKKNILPVSGTIDGKPALTLYGSSYEPTDYMFIDTPDKKISYEGVVFSYVYVSFGSNTIYMINPGNEIGRGVLITDTKTRLTIDTSYSISFGSKVYTSK